LDLLKQRTREHHFSAYASALANMRKVMPLATQISGTRISIDHAFKIRLISMGCIFSIGGQQQNFMQTSKLAGSKKRKETKSNTLCCRLTRNYLFKLNEILTNMHKMPCRASEHYFFLSSCESECQIVGNTHQPRETYLTIKHTGTILSCCQNFLSANT